MKTIFTAVGLAGAFAIIPTEASSAQNGNSVQIASCVSQSINTVRREFVPPAESLVPKTLEQEFYPNTVILSASRLSFPNRIQFSVLHSDGVSNTIVGRSAIRSEFTIRSDQSNDPLRDRVSFYMANNFVSCMNGQNLSNDRTPIVRYFDEVKPDRVRMRITFN